MAHFASSLGEEAVKRIQEAGPNVNAATLAKELGVSERTVYRVKAEHKKRLRAECGETVEKHVKDRLPDDLRRLDGLMNHAEKEMTKDTPRCAAWGNLLLNCLNLRFNFLGFPGKAIGEFNDKSDAELMAMVEKELKESRDKSGNPKSPTADSQIPFFVNPN